MNRQILLPRSAMAMLREALGVSKEVLWKATSFETNGRRAKQLRAAALQRGGVLYTGLVPESFLASVETTFDHQNKKIVQRFGDDLTIEIDQVHNTATLWAEGRIVHTIHGMDVGKWSRLLYGLQMIISELH